METPESLRSNRIHVVQLTRYSAGIVMELYSPPEDSTLQRDKCIKYLLKMGIYLSRMDNPFRTTWGKTEWKEALFGKTQPNRLTYISRRGEEPLPPHMKVY